MKLLVSVKSIFQPDKILVVKPKVIEIIFAIDEIRKTKAQGLERRHGRDKTRQLSTFPIVPKRKIRIVKYRLNCIEIRSNISTKSVLDALNIAER